MTTLTNAQGDKVKVNLGGFGGDNVLGGVEDSDGAPINNARVVVTNISNEQQETEDPTGNDGEYDVDVDAKAGDRLFIHAQWTDGAGQVHVVSGFVTLAAAAAAPDSPNISELFELEKMAQAKAASQVKKGLPADSFYQASDGMLTSILNGLGNQSSEDQKTILDRLMKEEVLQLLAKIRSARGRPRNDSDTWSAIEELMAMVLKLYFKTLILQGRGLELLPEPGPQPGPDLT